MRIRALDALDVGTPRPEVIRLFGVSTATLTRWRQGLGHTAYPGATRLLLTADGGGSNGSRLRLWKLELQRFADASGLELCVCHLPPGTSKWNKMSIGSSRTSPRIGAASRWSAMPRS